MQQILFRLQFIVLQQPRYRRGMHKRDETFALVTFPFGMPRESGSTIAQELKKKKRKNGGNKKEE